MDGARNTTVPNGNVARNVSNVGNRRGEVGNGRSAQRYRRHVAEHISQRELRQDIGRIMRALDEGRSFVVTRNGRSVGELRPLRRERFVDAAVVAEAFRDAPPLDWKGTRADLDRHIDQETTRRT